MLILINLKLITERLLNKLLALKSVTNLRRFRNKHQLQLCLLPSVKQARPIRAGVLWIRGQFQGR